MEFRLDRFSVLKFGLFSGVAYALMSLVILVPMFLFISAVGASVDDAETGGLFVGGGVTLIFMPFLYGIFGFIGGVIGALVYNLVAKVMGGIQFNLTNVDTSPMAHVGVPAVMPPASPIQ